MLAADKRVTFVGLARTTTKLARINGSLYAISGNACEGGDMLEWIRAGMTRSEFPASQSDEKTWVSCLEVSRGGLRLFERFPTPMVIEDRIFAMGCGRDYALAAMHLGRSAREGVEIACLFDVNCGNGVDVMEL